MLRKRRRRARARAAASSSPPPSCHTERASPLSAADDDSPPPTQAHTEAASKPRIKRARRRNHSPVHSEVGSDFLMDVDVDTDSAIKDGIAIMDEPSERCARPSAKRKRGAMTHRAGGTSVEAQTRNVTHHSLCSAADNRMPVVVDLVANTVTQVRYRYKKRKMRNGRRWLGQNSVLLCHSNECGCFLCCT